MAMFKELAEKYGLTFNESKYVYRVTKEKHLVY